MQIHLYQVSHNKKTSLNHKFKGGFDEVQVLLKHK